MRLGINYKCNNVMSCPVVHIVVLFLNVIQMTSFMMRRFLTVVYLSFIRLFADLHYVDPIPFGRNPFPLQCSSLRTCFDFPSNFRFYEGCSFFWGCVGLYFMIFPRLCLFPLLGLDPFIGTAGSDVYCLRALISLEIKGNWGL